MVQYGRGEEQGKLLLHITGCERSKIVQSLRATSRECTVLVLVSHGDHSFERSSGRRSAIIYGMVECGVLSLSGEAGRGRCVTDHTRSTSCGWEACVGWPPGILRVSTPSSIVARTSCG